MGLGEYELRGIWVKGAWVRGIKGVSLSVFFFFSEDSTEVVSIKHGLYIYVYIHSIQVVKGAGVRGLRGFLLVPGPFPRKTQLMSFRSNIVCTYIFMYGGRGLWVYGLRRLGVLG